MSDRSGEAGVVLIAVLWLLALLGGLTMAMSIATTSALSGIDVYNDRTRASAAITAGLNQAAAHLLTSPRPGSGSQVSTIGGARVRVSWVGETARLDVNLASADLLAGLFARLGAPPDAAAAYAAQIVALRGLPPERRTVPGTRPAYAPDDETPQAIRALARAGAPTPGADPHKPILDVAQLQQIAGLPPDLMARAAPFLTTFSGVAQIDPRLAQPELLESLPGMTRERLRTLLATRDRGPGGSDLTDVPGEAATFTTDKPAGAQRIRVEATLADKFTATSEIVIVTFADDRQPYRVLSWTDDVPTRHLAVTEARP